MQSLDFSALDFGPEVRHPGAPAKQLLRFEGHPGPLGLGELHGSLPDHEQTVAVQEVEAAKQRLIRRFRRGEFGDRHKDLDPLPQVRVTPETPRSPSNSFSAVWVGDHN